MYSFFFVLIYGKIAGILIWTSVPCPFVLEKLNP